ncbi:MAG: response regulator [Nitrospinae bacterium]|nr:response regulator [Nitrospinota bacterium]
MNPSLLVVEDDEVMCKTIAEVFEKKGLRVISAGNGEEAVNYLKKEIIDLALIDFRLPGMNGLTLLKAIKEIDDGIMVIVMTAYPEVKMAISAMKSGAYDYINKPFELEELKLLIDKALDNRKMKFEILRRQMMFEIGDVKDVSLWFKDRLGYSVYLPHIDEPGLKLIGGRKCKLGGNEVAYLFYQKGGKRVSLYIVDSKKIKYEMEENKKYHFPFNECEVDIWKSGNAVYSMVR